MKIIRERLALAELKRIAASTFVNLVKAVVDINKGIIAIDAELHSDLEALLLENGSKQESLWGINLYPDAAGDDFIEFDSMINVRPSHGNRTRGIEDDNVRKRAVDIVVEWIKR
jgi:hypothetical protein